CFPFNCQGLFTVSHICSGKVIPCWFSLPVDRSPQNTQAFNLSNRNTHTHTHTHTHTQIYTQIQKQTHTRMNMRTDADTHTTRSHRGAKKHTNMLPQTCRQAITNTRKHTDIVFRVAYMLYTHTHTHKHTDIVFRVAYTH